MITGQFLLPFNASQLCKLGPSLGLKSRNHVKLTTLAKILPNHNRKVNNFSARKLQLEIVPG
ncbi:hypothetical protein T4B_7096 [Trichinella pseudospiralis]|uniref:Uncharacterized protein n=1 Tax=Trichinella pseudospiralis TaxID=6337 RepID=A0A0V1J7U1_TRIPS|nr:hypothetical protein T4A_14084 [Trichinella pseudospiralis]KRZ24538.1 hypothetical protein T4B_7096 [Trichinella pseudospiralis]KRZ31065.1 hypothetical protein T4C_9767 [Trichinella pseudospiralis]